jgi:hypothetical protein
MGTRRNLFWARSDMIKPRDAQGFYRGFSDRRASQKRSASGLDATHTESKSNWAEGEGVSMQDRSMDRRGLTRAHGEGGAPTSDAGLRPASSTRRARPLRSPRRKAGVLVYLMRSRASTGLLVDASQEAGEMATGDGETKRFTASRFRVACQVHAHAPPRRTDSGIDTNQACPQLRLPGTSRGPHGRSCS